MVYYLRSVKVGFIQRINQLSHLFSTMTQKVFVYGTLKRNEPNHHWLTDPKNGVGTFVAEGKTNTKYPLIIGTKYNIPFLLYSPGKGYNVKALVTPVVNYGKYAGVVYQKTLRLIKKSSKINTICEVYDVDETMLGQLDILEDHPNYYVREVDDILVTKSGSSETETVQCWVYFLKNFRPELLSKQQFENYSSTGAHGLNYLESNNESTIDDLHETVKDIKKK